jgi:hypothetical protein
MRDSAREPAPKILQFDKVRGWQNDCQRQRWILESKRDGILCADVFGYSRLKGEAQVDCGKARGGGARR